MLQFSKFKVTIILGIILLGIIFSAPNLVPRDKLDSLPGWVPKTRRARKLCFARHHICRAIANWHGVAAEGPPTVNPAEAGLEGWSTMGTAFRVGDSWYTGMRPGASFAQLVSVDASLGPRTITFMCAIHPQMRGTIEVQPSLVPAPVSPSP